MRPPRSLWALMKASVKVWGSPARPKAQVASGRDAAGVWTTLQNSIRAVGPFPAYLLGLSAHADRGPYVVLRCSTQYRWPRRIVRLSVGRLAAGERRGDVDDVVRLERRCTVPHRQLVEQEAAPGPDAGQGLRGDLAGAAEAGPIPPNVQDNPRCADEPRYTQASGVLPSQMTTDAGLRAVPIKQIWQQLRRYAPKRWSELPRWPSAYPGLHAAPDP